MTFIVIFNLGSWDNVIMTDGHGFLEEFSDPEIAKREAADWLDGTQYRNYAVYEQITNTKKS